MRVVVRDGSDYKRVYIFVCPRCSNVVLSDMAVEMCDNCCEKMRDVDGHYYISKFVYDHIDVYEWKCDENFCVQYREKYSVGSRANEWKKISNFDL